MTLVEIIYGCGDTPVITFDGIRFKPRLPGPVRFMERLLLAKGFVSYDEIMDWLWEDPDLMPLAALKVIGNYACLARAEMQRCAPLFVMLTRNGYGYQVLGKQPFIVKIKRSPHVYRSGQNTSLIGDSSGGDHARAGHLQSR